MYPVELITKDCEILKGIIHDDGTFEEREVDAKFIATPTFFNAHTHLADSVAKDIPRMDLIEAIKYKFRVLGSESEDEIVEGIKNSINFALRSGTSKILEFREGGIHGFEILRKGDDLGICLPLTRPSSVEEAEILADLSFGFGMSSVRDHDYMFLEEIREIAKRKKKLFAIHAGEKDDEDVEGALALEPDLLIHMNMASFRNLKIAMDMEIPIVSCLRSNAFFGLLNMKNYEALVEYEFWLLGTDNAMVCNPSMLEEMHFSSYLLRRDNEIFRASVKGFDLFNLEHGVVVFNKKFNLNRCRDPILGIVRRAETIDIEKVISKFSYEHC